jgi:hypothetical protein
MSKAKKAIPMVAPAGIGDGGRSPKKKGPKVAEDVNPHSIKPLSPAEQDQRRDKIKQMMGAKKPSDSAKPSTPWPVHTDPSLKSPRVKKSLPPGMSYKRLKEIESEEDDE